MHGITKPKGGGKYLAMPSHTKLYTNNLRYAKIFMDWKTAELSKCNGEKIVELREELHYFNPKRKPK